MARPLREELAASLVNAGKTADFRTIDYRTFTSKEHQIERERGRYRNSDHTVRWISYILYLIYKIYKYKSQKAKNCNF